MTSSPRDLTHGKHLPVLDGVRGMAILLVLFHHFFHTSPAASHSSLADKVVFAAASRSWFGVDLFFVLSGFLITGILLDAKGQTGYFKNFYIRRVLRIFPAFYFCLVVFFVILPMVPIEALAEYLKLGNRTADQVWHWTYLSNFRIAANEGWYPHNFPNAFWSLAIEEQFYLVWPMVVLALPRKALSAVCLVLFGVALGVRLTMLSMEYNWIQRFVFTFARMDGLVIGAFLANLLRSEIDLRKSRLVWFLIGVVALVGFGYLTSQRPPNWRDDAQQTFRFSLVALFFASALWISVTSGGRGLLHWVFTRSFLLMLGKYSYAIYIWHGPMTTLMKNVFDPETSDLIGGTRLPEQLLFSALAFAASMVAGLISWHLIEKHFLRLKKAFS